MKVGLGGFMSDLIVDEVRQRKQVESKVSKAL